MAQIGSFVPAASAKIAVVDGIFTRYAGYFLMHEGQSQLVALTLDDR